VMASLMERAIRRARVTSDALAVAQVPRVEDRLLILFWHLADRFGRVTPDGVVLPLRLSHEMLAALIGAQRPTVTAALAPLVERGLVQRRADRQWLLTGDAPELAKTVR
jgi:CRP/FNR family transcriptional regulator, cyclic AMP receptor protein